MKKQTKYDALYFLKKFDAIPEEKWCEWDITDEHERHCVLGHCGSKDSPQGFILTTEAKALDRLFLKTLRTFPEQINDLFSRKYSDLGKTPKQRIMNALELIYAGVQL